MILIRAIDKYDNLSMDIRQTECFVAVAEARSFTRAADRLFAVQSTVSAAIKNLEAEIGTALFDRTTKHVRLTPAGSAFLPAARELLLAHARAKVVAADLSTGLRGELRVGTMSGLQATDHPRLFAAFRKHYPNVDVHLKVSSSGSSGVADDIRAGRLDVGLVSLPDSGLKDLSVRELTRARMVLIVGPRHRLARIGAARLRDLEGEEFVDSPAGFGTRMIVDGAFREVNVRRRISFEVADASVISNYVEEHLGIAIVPESVIPDGTDIVQVDLLDLRVYWPLYAAVLRSAPRTRAVSAFLDLLTEHASIWSWEFGRQRERAARRRG